ncbi:hypothetical protein C1645_840566 [Glomus cerebriforme]|uniref:Uncharacterized protein n=1 Tax=Glomus cerebriforme TaxID=658196 RepID=A0A397S672_9GLOM|nr:hypothetical protein C1645_840566 [Glomus cerebriforme]
MLGYCVKLNVKLLVEIIEFRKKFAEIKSKNAEIPELRRKVADIEAENVKLRQIIEKNTKHDIREVASKHVVYG